MGMDSDTESWLLLEMVERRKPNGNSMCFVPVLQERSMEFSAQDELLPSYGRSPSLCVIKAVGSCT